MSQHTPAAEWREKGEPDPHGNSYHCDRARLTLGHLTDDALANGAFMNYDRPLDVRAVMDGKPDYHPPIAWMTAVKDRIRWLSRRTVKLEAQRDDLISALQQIKNSAGSPGLVRTIADDAIAKAEVQS